MNLVFSSYIFLSLSVALRLRRVGAAPVASCAMDTSVEACSFLKVSTISNIWMCFSNDFLQSVEPAFHVIVCPCGATLEYIPQW